MHDLHDLLGRVERSRHLVAECPLLHPGAELAHHGQSDVGIEEGDPNLAHGVVDVGLGQAALAAQVLKRGGKTVGQ
ncbi:unannotated protein [freshwater metagenome]|uniref:Unannotated protein n=1 Tax=freshwater metagenome TaxID=449393 RepID=A0A6J7Q5L6_9ZZZZ